MCLGKDKIEGKKAEGVEDLKGDWNFLFMEIEEDGKWEENGKRLKIRIY